VQERILYIELMNGPRAGDGQGEHRADDVRLDHRPESLIVVDAGPLGEAAKNLASLVPFQGTVRVELVPEDPIVGDDVGANRRGTSSQVLLAIRASYSSSMARRQDG
jgi:hypothetical protein